VEVKESATDKRSRRTARHAGSLFNIGTGYSYLFFATIRAAFPARLEWGLTIFTSAKPRQGNPRRGRPTIRACVSHSGGGTSSERNWVRHLDKLGGAGRRKTPAIPFRFRRKNLLRNVGRKLRNRRTSQRAGGSGYSSTRNRQASHLGRLLPKKPRNEKKGVARTGKAAKRIGGGGER